MMLCRASTILSAVKLSSSSSPITHFNFNYNLAFRACPSPSFYHNSWFGKHKFSKQTSESVRFKRLSSTAPMANEDKAKEEVMKIHLTDLESKIFDRLMEVVRHFGLSTQLRVAGGWVRDKLLGKDCSDIDIALDNMLGREFCDKVNEYLANAGEKTQGVGVIQCNPDQSKHLETARMRIFDVWVDFVNLRSETYAEHSRIPSMEFGTAEQDAYRRDLTINSLFYNINTGSVEDLTGRGKSDLKVGIIATPLPPKATFLDDPLRVLRAIRFGARFDFTLDNEVKKAASDEEVKAALASKISRERIGHEIDLMVSGNEPFKAFNLIEEMQLFWTVFNLPQDASDELPQDCERLCIKNLEAVSDLIHKVGFATLNDDHRRFCLYSALFLPLRKTTYVDRKGKTIPVASAVIKDSLKLKVNDAETVINLHSAAEEFYGLMDLLISGKNNTSIDEEDNFDDLLTYHLDDLLTAKQRIQTGLLLRKIKALWRVAVFLSTLLKYPVSACSEVPEYKSVAEKRAVLYISIEKTVLQLGLENSWKMKPLLDGKAIMSMLGLETGGPEIKKWLDRVIKWQLANPSGTEEECLDWLQQTRAKRFKAQ